MSRENVEIVRAAYDALSRGDIDAALKNVSPDAEYDVPRALGPVHGIFRGHDEIRKSWEEFSEPWESQRWEVDEFIEQGEHVATPMTNHLRGRDEIESRLCCFSLDHPRRGRSRSRPQCRRSSPTPSRSRKPSRRRARWW